MIEIPAAGFDNLIPDCIEILIPEYAQPEWLALAERLKAKRISQIYVKLGAPRKPRTTGWKSQNHAINGYCAQICEHTGEDFDDVKLYAKRKAMRRGLPVMINAHGDIVYSRNDGEPLPMSERDMDTVQASWVVAELLIIADDLGIKLEGSVKETDE